MVLLIWLGPLLMAIGGTFSMADRRLRFGAPQAARANRAAGFRKEPRREGGSRAALRHGLRRDGPCRDADEMLKDPAKESRARALSAELRCLVCQNQSIDDSDAQLARDLRLIVRERITAAIVTKIRDFLVARYGEFVLLRPSFSLENAALWGLPFLALAAGGWFLLAQARNRSRALALPQPAPLTAEEEAALAARLGSAEPPGRTGP